MKNHYLKVGVATPHVYLASPEENAKSIITLIKKHADLSLLVFPELSLTGYTCQDLFFQDALLDDALKALVQVAQATEGLHNTVVVGLPLRFQNKLYNVAAYLSDGQVKGLVPKIHIPNYSEFYEARWFASGKDILGQTYHCDAFSCPFSAKLLFVDETSSALIGTDICEDLWVLDKPSNEAILAGANIICNPSASDEHIAKASYRKELVLNQSAVGYCAYLYAASGDEESSQDLVFSGHSMIAENGHLLAETIYPEPETVLTGIFDLDEMAYDRIHQSTFLNRVGEYQRIPVSVKPLTGKKEISAEELKDALEKESYRVPKMPFVPSDEKARTERSQEILRIQAHGLATRMKNTGLRNMVIGISGGLDSTLALLVCHEAKKLVPDSRIYGYTMPNEGNTTSLTYNNAVSLMKALGIEPKTLPIGEGVKNHLLLIGHPLSYQGNLDTAYENAQARMRTYILMDIANMVGGLVIGTGDLSELALGWCTYNGDHMAMYAVNTSVPKTLVQYMVYTYAVTMADETLKKTLLSVLDTPISPELTPSRNGEIAQKTEEKIGKYDLNDFFLYYYLRFGARPEKIFALASLCYPKLSKEDLKKAMIRFYSRFFSQQFKRSCLPDGPKVGSLTLSPRGDYRMPSDSKATLFLSLIKAI